MFGRTQSSLWVAAGLLWATAAQADLGYLPMTGPMPLRYRMHPSPESTLTEPPPPPPPSMALPSVPPPIQLPVPAMPAQYGPDTNAFFAGSISNGPPVEFNARDASETNSFPIISSPDPVVVPQMLVKYFTTATNSPTNAVVSLPPTSIGFNPPSGSTATPKPTTPPAPTPAPAAPKPTSP